MPVPLLVAPMVGWIVTAAGIVFRSRIGMFFVYALAWLGITYGTQKILVSPVLDQIADYVNAMNSTGGEWGAWMLNGLGMLKFDIAATMWISAVTTRAAVSAARIRLTKA